MFTIIFAMMTALATIMMITGLIRKTHVFWIGLLNVVFWGALTFFGAPRANPLWDGIWAWLKKTLYL